MSLRRNIRRNFMVCLAIGAGIGALFGLALIVSAIYGKNSASNILVAGAGLIVLIVSVLVEFSAVASLRSSGD